MERVSPINPASTPAFATCASSQPYGSIAVDALNKAHDHLENGIKMLRPVLDQSTKKAKERSSRRQVEENKDSQVTVISIENDDYSSDSDDDEDEKKQLSEDENMQISVVATQLFGLHHKLINVSLRLAEIRLRNYWSSSAMQALRTAARTLADAVHLVQLVANDDASDSPMEEWMQMLCLQYIWLWEHCGHFARSFAADNLWRERGHTSGDDIISVLQDAEAAFSEHADLNEVSGLSLHLFLSPKDPLSTKSHGMVNLHSLSAIVDVRFSNNKSTEEELESHKGAVNAAGDVLAKQGLIQRDQRKVLVAAALAYHRAIEGFQELSMNGNDGIDGMVDSTLLGLLQQRLGDACNEIGKILLNELRSLLSGNPAGQASDNKDISTSAAEPLLSSAEFWFLEGLEAFEKCRDLRNLALLRCNLCQCCKLRANAIFASQHSTDGPTHAEACLQEAANHLQSAHEALGQRDTDPNCWDMVSTELAATFLVLGVRRRQSLIGSGNMPVIAQALRLSPGKERSIVEPMERALEIYEQAGNYHQAAAAHYQLALFYSKIWTCQRDEIKTRAKLAAAFSHYNAAHGFFSQAVRGNEATFCLLCIDMSSLYAAVSGEECVTNALLRCLDTVNAFSPEAIDRAASDLNARVGWFEQMDTLATSVEERVFKLIRNLVKLEEAKAEKSTKYKDLYRVGLQSKMSGDPTSANPTGDPELDKVAGRLLALHKVLDTLQKELKSPPA